MGTSRMLGGLAISIHAAQEGCDFQLWLEKTGEVISIHAAQEGCDILIYVFNTFYGRNFNPRSPRGLRPMTLPDFRSRFIISIHAAQEGCDVNIMLNNNQIKISIHAAQEGCDVHCRA